MKKWKILAKPSAISVQLSVDELIKQLLENRGLKTSKEIHDFILPSEPNALNSETVGINKNSLRQAISRIKHAIKKKESIVVYADYDADGITAGAIMWEVLHKLGAQVMPYIPHRVDEGYGLSVKGIDAVKNEYNPTLIVTVDHGITAKEKIDYAKKIGIEVIVTDHHVKPEKPPRCITVHTTKLSGAGISWFVAKELIKKISSLNSQFSVELLALAAIGTIADMVPLVGPNRSIVKYGLVAINKTKRVGLLALLADAALEKNYIGTYEVSHILAPRLNAMGRLVHAMDALRLLCTKQADKALLLAQKLGLTNRERQQLTMDTTLRALQDLTLQNQGQATKKKLIFVSHEEYNQGVIGLVAGKLVEEYYRPAIVVAKGEVISKASARSINGFNIVETIRMCSDILIDVGGHPMAAGFTIETRNLKKLQDRLEQIADRQLDEEKLTRMLRIDAEIPLELVNEEFWKRLRDLEPFGFGNPEPVFATLGLKVMDTRLVGADGKHLKLKIIQSSNRIEAIAFGMGSIYSKLKPDKPIDIAYTIAVDTWNGNKRLQLKIKDIHLPES